MAQHDKTGKRQEVAALLVVNFIKGPLPIPA